MTERFRAACATGQIGCRGDAYLRPLLIQSPRSSLQRAKAVATEKASPERLWIRSLAGRLPFGKALVAIANKHARQAWAMLAREVDNDAHACIRCTSKPRWFEEPFSIPRQREAVDNGFDHPGENLINSSAVQNVLRLSPGAPTIPTNERGRRVRFIPWSAPLSPVQQDRLQMCSLTNIALP